MKDLQEATEKICELKGENFALQVMFDALVRSLPPHVVQDLAANQAQAAEIARVVLLNEARVGESVISSFDHHTQNMASMLQKALKPF